MNILSTLKKVFADYLIPGIILVGSILLFIILSSILFHIKRFYLFILLFFSIICLIVSLFVTKQKFIRTIHILCSIFFLIMFGLIIKLTIVHKNPWALVYKISDVSNVAKKLYYKPITSINLPTKVDTFTTYLRLELKSILNTKSPINENFFGFNITFHCYAYLTFLLREIFVDQDYYVDLNNDAPIIIDCGCNEGLSILFFKMVYPKAKILGFEAHPKSFAVLNENIQRNNLTNITLINKAVYDSEGSVTFSADNFLGSHLLKKTQTTRCITVPSTLLSTYINEPVDLLKMDIEGAESPVIEELSQHKKLKFIKRIIMEFHAPADKNHNHFARLLRTLEENGFSYQMKNFDSTVQVGIIYAYKQ